MDGQPHDAFTDGGNTVIKMSNEKINELEKHHIAETSFLIFKIRELALQLLEIQSK